MKNLYLDEITKDLSLTEDKNLRFTVNNSEFVSQKIENKLLFFKGEWFLDYQAGIPYLAKNNEDRDNPEKNIFVKNPDFELVNTIFREAIANIEEIEEIVKFETEYNNALRKYNVNFTVKIKDETINGSVSI